MTCVQMREHKRFKAKKQTRIRIPTPPMTNRTTMNLTIALVVLLLTGCTSVEESTDITSAYRSVWAELYPDTLAGQHAEGTLYGDFYSAAASDTRIVAERRWEKFLSDWMPGNAAFEDASHARFVNWAKLEIQRLRYLKHKNIAAAETTSKRLRQIAADME